MLEEITLSFFQNHLNSRLELSPGVNVIRGESDQGKSAVVRAVSWVVNNRPQGTENVMRGRYATDLTEVSVQTSDDHYISRQRDRKNINQYELVSGEEAPLELKALRTDVPEEIKDALRMDGVNIQGQHDDYFLLRQSPGEVARSFNRAVGLDTIDESLTRIGSMATNGKSAAATERERLAGLDTDLAKYAQVDDLLERARTAHELEEEAEQLETKARDLSACLRTHKTCTETLEQYASVDRAADLETDALDQFAQYNEIAGRARRLTILIRERAEAQGRVDSAAIVDETAIAQMVTEVEAALNEEDNLLKQIRRLRFLMKDWKDFAQGETEAGEDEQDARAKYAAAFAEVDKCPLCYQKVDKKAAKAAGESI